MKAVAKEHSDVIESLQTQTVNSTLEMACQHSEHSPGSQDGDNTATAAVVPMCHQHFLALGPERALRDLREL